MYEVITAFEVQYFGRDAAHDRVVWHILDYHGIRTDGDIIANCDLAKHFCACADVDPITDPGRPSVLTAASHADGNTLRNVAAFPQPRMSRDEHWTKVADIQARTDIGSGRKMDIGGDFHP